MKIFYSWQSDLPNSTNRGFIEEALEKAVKVIKKDNSIKVVPVIDRDTQGIPGSPDIVSTILKKIDEADVFVCDVSLISRKGETEEGKEIRSTPNPNVLVELGYALSKLGWHRVITVINEAYGKADDLPFDLKQKRALVYRLAIKDSDKAPERNDLARAFEGHLRVIISEYEQQIEAVTPKELSPFDLANESVLNSRTNQSALVNRYMIFLLKELNSIKPDYSNITTHAQIIETLIGAINKSKNLVLAFSQLAQNISEMQSEQAAQALYKGFELILLECYPSPKNYLSSYWREFDFYRFIGHELFVTFFSFLLRNDCWKLIGELLSEDFFVPDPQRGGRIAKSYAYLSDYLHLLQKPTTNYYSSPDGTPHSEILYKRHTDGELGVVVPIEQFMDGDFLLLLRSILGNDNNRHKFEWWCWSCKNLNEIPKFLLEASKPKQAVNLMTALNISDLPTLKKQFVEQLAHVKGRFNERFWRFELQKFDPEIFGSR